MLSNLSLTCRLVKKNLKPAALRNILTLANLLFFSVILLLSLFREFRDAFFLFIAVVPNILIGIVQELRAKIALEKLQMLAAPKIIRLDAGGEMPLTLEEIRQGDKLKISIGDQVPVDGELLSGRGLEINEALLSGESDSRSKAVGDKILAGSIVTAGSGVLLAAVAPHESYIARMTEKIKRYSSDYSPIQKTLNLFIQCMAYVLLAVVVYVLFHGLTTRELLVSIVKDIAALTGTLIPQGLILATTMFFAYGAIRMFKRQVLLQEINATEKLGRIENLCLDKTGTLTENAPCLEETIVYRSEPKANIASFIQGYVFATGDDSETVKAIARELPSAELGIVYGALPFSSRRKFGEAALRMRGEIVTIVVGAPDILMRRIVSDGERQWVKNLIDEHTPKAKRLVLMARSNMSDQSALPDMAQSPLYPLAMFVLANPLRPGTREIIDFFQKRKVHIRVISGDNPRTVQAVARAAGIKNVDLVATGPEIEKWDDEAFEERVQAYHVFARITPEQKEKIISHLKRTGFTAMIGDGANDALAIKNADLGVAMFGGAGATRQIAQIVLLNNSFSALPAGVTLAETVITNIELVASVFFNKVIVGLLLFSGLAFLGFTYPISPRNITIINYCVVFIPVLYWTLLPARKQEKSSRQSFLRKVLPFSVITGLLTVLAAIVVFMLSPAASRDGNSNVYVVLVLIVLGYWFFVLSPQAYGQAVVASRTRALQALAAAILFVLIYVMRSSSLSLLFDLYWPELLPLGLTLAVIGLFAWAQYKVMIRWFSHHKADRETAAADAYQVDI